MATVVLFRGTRRYPSPRIVGYTRQVLSEETDIDVRRSGFNEKRGRLEARRIRRRSQKTAHHHQSASSTRAPDNWALLPVGGSPQEGSALLHHARCAYGRRPLHLLCDRVAGPIGTTTEKGRGGGRTWVPTRRDETRLIPGAMITVVNLRSRRDPYVCILSTDPYRLHRSPVIFRSHEVCRALGSSPAGVPLFQCSCHAAPISPSLALCPGRGPLLRPPC